MTATSTQGDLHGVANELLEEYVVDAGLQGLTERTIETYQSQIGYFLEWLDGDPLSVERIQLKAFLAHLKEDRRAMDGSTGLSPSTINSYFAALNSFYKFLIFEGYADDNPVPSIRDRYVPSPSNDGSSDAQLITIEEMSTLVRSTIDVRNRALIVLLAKTGIRRNELIKIDLDDIHWERGSITLKPTPKRSNRVVFFDDECARTLQRWIETRGQEDSSTDALFTNQYGGRLKRTGVERSVTKQAELVGLHDPGSTNRGDRFTPHCCRHWFTTHLRRSGMKREYIQELRGDTRGDAIDIYDHIDRQELREAYLAHIPELGI